ncbi:hypothetical protein BD410DRAFT_771633 [Rickenella mellea]|uniref:BTB domain-containing protein n=1 Tax=Rickenella mellea TaxID=50990 RepID=A0A4Y7Q190_9AGAM|nr:hypothetical protein BD410DRAFT_771633 [Rickenella mellea]
MSHFLADCATAEAASVPLPREVHPSYSDPNADILLESGDGVEFHVHSLIMKMSSGFFRDMLGLPGNLDNQEPIVMEESAIIVGKLLDLVYPNTGSPEIDPSLIWEVATAGDKYDMPPALRNLRYIVESKMHANQLDPIVTYSYACRFGWEDVAKAASTKTLDIDLSTLDESQISIMDCRGLFRLQNLHRARREAAFELLDIAYEPDSHHVAFHRCTTGQLFEPINSCCMTRGDFPFWILLKQSVSRELEKFSSGKTLHDDEFWRRSEFNELWKTSFPSHKCNGYDCKAFDRLATKLEVLRVLNSEHVPKTV